MVRSSITFSLVVAASLIGASSGTGSQQSQQKPAADVSEYVAPAVQRLTAKTVRTYEAPEATQGVAASRRFFYAIDNTILAKYDIASGRFIDRWVGPRRGLVRHMNSCLVETKRVWCANSNYNLT